MLKRIVWLMFCGVLTCGLLLGQIVLAWIPPDFEEVPTITHTNVLISSATSTPVLVRKTNRILLILQNMSDDAIDCKIDATAVKNEGIRLSATSTPLFFDTKYPIGAVNCINVGSNWNPLSVTEGSRP